MPGFLRNNFVVGIAEILARLPLLLSAGILARSVGAEIYGGWAVILVYQALAAALAGLGLDSSLSRLASVASPGAARAYLLLALRTCALSLAMIAGLTFALSAVLTPALGVEDHMRPVLAASGLLTAMTVSEGLLSSYFKAREMISRYVCFVVIRTVSEIVAVALVFLVLPSQQPVGALLQYLLLLCALKATGYGALALLRPGPRQPMQPARRREFLTYGLPMVPAVLLSWFTLQGDRVLLAHLVPPAPLGVYAFGASLAGYLVYVGYAVFPLLLTRASQLHDSGDREGLRRLFATYQRVMISAYVAALGVTLPFARDIAVLLAGPEFETAAMPFAVLSLAVCADRVFGVYQYVFHLVKRPSWILALSCFNAALMTSAVVYAAKTHGVGAVPWALMLATLIFNAVRFSISRRLLPLAWPAFPAVALGAIILLGWLAASAAGSWPATARAALAGSACLAALAMLNAVLDGRPVLAFRNLIARAGARSR